MARQHDIVVRADGAIVDTCAADLMVADAVIGARMARATVADTHGAQCANPLPSVNTARVSGSAQSRSERVSVPKPSAGAQDEPLAVVGSRERPAPRQAAPAT